MSENSNWFDNRVEKKDNESSQEVLDRLKEKPDDKKGSDDDFIKRMERMHQLGYKVRYYLLFAMILLMIGFAVVPRFIKNEKLHLSAPLDLGKTVYLRADSGDWYRMSISDDEVYDSLNAMISGTYKKNKEQNIAQREMTVLFVCRVAQSPMHVHWFYDGRYCESKGEDLWMSYDREESPFSYSEMTSFIIENGRLLEESELPEWTKDLKQ